jgi:hypothetical protein
VLGRGPPGTARAGRSVSRSERKGKEEGAAGTVPRAGAVSARIGSQEARASARTASLARTRTSRRSRVRGNPTDRWTRFRLERASREAVAREGHSRSAPRACACAIYPPAVRAGGRADLAGIASGSSAAAIICSPLSGVRRRVDGALHPDPCDERARAGARECPAAVTAIDASPSAAADPLHAPAAARASCRPITRPAFRPRGNASATPLPCPFPGRSRGASTDRRDAPSWGPTPAASEGPTRTAPDAGSLRRTGSSAARRRSCRRGRGRAGTGRRPRA